MTVYYSNRNKILLFQHVSHLLNLSGTSFYFRMFLHENSSENMRHFTVFKIYKNVLFVHILFTNFETDESRGN